AHEPTRVYDLILSGSMSGYNWQIGGADRLRARRGDRLRLAMSNMSMMGHPMHLHGHHFQVVAINGVPIDGAVRDTVHVPPMARVEIEFVADNPGRWPFHCHHLYHMASGMMSFVQYEGSI
ncbi:MAG: multicopper oxidase domain-containing protein, partial [Allorhizobium sp.]